MNKEKRIAILTRLRDENPHPTTELNFTSPFELLIAVSLSAQATDVSVNKATALLYPVANTPKDRKSTRLNSSHITRSRMPSSA